MFSGYLIENIALNFRDLWLIASEKSHGDPVNQIQIISKTMFFGSTCCFARKKLRLEEKNVNAKFFIRFNDNVISKFWIEFFRLVALKQPFQDWQPWNKLRDFLNFATARSQFDRHNPNGKL